MHPEPSPQVHVYRAPTALPLSSCAGSDRQLHKFRIDFKILVLTFRALNGQAPVHSGPFEAVFLWPDPSVRWPEPAFSPKDSL